MIGWLKSNSIASLVASALSSGLLALGLYVFVYISNLQQVGVYMMGVTALFLLVFSIRRLFQTGKFMPSGMIMLLSVAEINLLWIFLASA